MLRISAGLLVYRRAPQLQVLLVHPGGPFWKNRDAGAWSIPKGEANPGEELLATAKREFEEELGMAPPQAEPLALAPVRQKGGKIVHAWAVEGEIDVSQFRSNEVRTPAGKGRWITAPEVDRAAYFDLETARQKISAAQAALLDELETYVGQLADPRLSMPLKIRLAVAKL